MTRSTLAACFLLGLSFHMSACVTAPAPHYHRQRQAPVQRAVGINYCPDRLPAAQARVEQLCQQAYNAPTVRRHTTVVRDRWGKSVHVTVVTESQQPISRHQVQTGLTDLVLNCGNDGHTNDCFVKVWLDGQLLADISPTHRGLVPFRCLLAGRRHLRITSPGNRVVFDGFVLLQSDHQHTMEIRRRGGFRMYNGVYLADRVPPIPQRVVRRRTTRRRVVHDHHPHTRPHTHPHTRPHTHPRTTQPRTTPPRRRVVRRRTTVHQPPARRVMSPSAFASLKTSIKRTSFDKDRMVTLRTSTPHSFFTSDQARQLVALFSFKSGRVDAAVLLYSRIVDKQNFHVVYRSFKFSSERRETSRRLGLQ